MGSSEGWAREWLRLHGVAVFRDPSRRPGDPVAAARALAKFCSFLRVVVLPTAAEGATMPTPVCDVMRRYMWLPLDKSLVSTEPSDYGRRFVVRCTDSCRLNGKRCEPITRARFRGTGTLTQGRARAMGSQRLPFRSQESRRSLSVRRFPLHCRVSGGHVYFNFDKLILGSYTETATGERGDKGEFCFACRVAVRPQGGAAPFTLIFAGMGPSLAESDAYDRRVKVLFQPKGRLDADGNVQWATQVLGPWAESNFPNEWLLFLDKKHAHRHAKFVDILGQLGAKARVAREQRGVARPDTHRIDHPRACTDGSSASSWIVDAVDAMRVEGMGWRTDGVVRGPPRCESCV